MISILGRTPVAIDKQLDLLANIQNPNIREDLLKEIPIRGLKSCIIVTIDSDLDQDSLKQHLKTQKNGLDRDRAHIYVSSDNYLVVEPNDSSEKIAANLRVMQNAGSSSRQRDSFLKQEDLIKTIVRRLPEGVSENLTNDKLTNISAKDAALIHDTHRLVQVLRDKDRISDWKSLPAVVRNNIVPQLFANYFGNDLSNLCLKAEKYAAIVEAKNAEALRIEQQEERQKRLKAWQEIKLPLFSVLAASVAGFLSFKVGVRHGLDLSSDNNEAKTAAMVKKFVPDSSFGQHKRAQVYLPVHGEGQLANLSIFGFDKSKDTNGDIWSFDVLLNTKAGTTTFNAILSEKSQGFSGNITVREINGVNEYNTSVCSEAFSAYLRYVIAAEAQNK
jgi:hypothetical protein